MERSPQRVQIVDGANVVGSRADGWWRDRAATATRLLERLKCADLPYDALVLVLEGRAKKGSDAGDQGGIRGLQTRIAAAGGQVTSPDGLLRQLDSNWVDK